MQKRLDVRAWALWLVACLAVVFALDHPVVDVVVTIAAALVASSAGASTRVFKNFLVLGLVLLALRTILFALTGHTGATVVMTLPSLHLPTLLGGAKLGGPVTAEVIASSISEGVRIVAVVACFGAFLAVTESIEVIRLLPRFLFEAGLIVSIAMAFAPQLARTARDIKDAQLMRGARRRLAPIVVPVVASALERSTSLAESMDSRGYGRVASPTRTAAPWSAVAALSALLASALAALWAMGKNAVVTGPMTLGAIGLLAFSLSRVAEIVPRVRYRRRRWGSADWSVAALAFSVTGFAILYSATGHGAAAFNPYLQLGLPTPDVLSIVMAALLALPGAAVVSGADR